MGNAVQHIRANVLDVLRSTHRLIGQLSSQQGVARAIGGAELNWLFDRAYATACTHAQDLAEHLQRLGGGAAPSEPSQERSVSEVFSERKILDDLYAWFSLAQAAALMLETNARALNFSSTAALASRHREEIAATLAHIKEYTSAAA